MKEGQSEFAREFSNNEYVMEMALRAARGKKTRHAVRPTLSCEVRYAAISIRCEAVLETHYQLVSNWTSDRNIRNAVENFEQQLRKNIEI